MNEEELTQLMQDQRDMFANEARRLRAENEKLRAALKPFADEGGLIIREAIDNHFWCGNVTIGDLRAAAVALKETGDE